MIALPLVSVFAIIAIVAAVVAVSAEKIATTGILIFVVVALHNCIGYALGFVLAKVCGFKLKQKKTLAIEIGMQNSMLQQQQVRIKSFSYSSLLKIYFLNFIIYLNYLKSSYIIVKKYIFVYNLLSIILKINK